MSDGKVNVSHQVGSQTTTSGETTFNKTSISGSVNVNDSTRVGGSLSVKDMNTPRGPASTSKTGVWVEHAPTGNSSVGLSFDTTSKDFGGRTSTVDKIGLSGAFGSTEVGLSSSRGSTGSSKLEGSASHTLNLGGDASLTGSAGLTKFSSPNVGSTTRDFGAELSVPIGPTTASLGVNTSRETGRDPGGSFATRTTDLTAKVSVPIGPSNTSLSYNTSKETGTFGPTTSKTFSIDTKVPVSPGGGYVTGGYSTGSTSYGGRSYPTGGLSGGVGCSYNF